MQAPTSLQEVCERLAVLDTQIDALQVRLVDQGQREGHAPLEDLEQTLLTLIRSREVLSARLEQMQRARPQFRPLSS